MPVENPPAVVPPGERPITASVIIPHYDNLAGLDACLAALSRQVGLGDRRVEIVVADNASPCGLERVEAIVAGRARVVLAPEKGAGPARNAGMAAARGIAFAFTDSDCLPEPGWLAAGLAALEKFDLAGGAMEVLVSREGHVSGAEAFEKVFAFDNESYVLRKGFSVTANLFCAAETARAIGPFRTEVSEDLEWCHRGRAMGFVIGYVPDAVVGHPARENWRALLRKWRRIDRESWALHRQRGGSRLAWLGRTWLLPLSIVPHGVKAARSPALSGMRDRAKAMATLAALRLWRVWDQHAAAFQKPR